MIPRVFCVCFILTVRIGTLSAQLGFHPDSSSQWRFYTGLVDFETAGIALKQEESAIPGRHRWVETAGETDVFVQQECGVELPTTPPAVSNAFWLGNTTDGAEAEAVEIDFMVPEQDYWLRIQYALVMEDPYHDPGEHPSFRALLFRESGEVVKCQYHWTPDQDYFPQEACNDWKVNPWDHILVDLSDYTGERLTIRITTNDCSKGGHAGYAYFALEMVEPSFSVQKDCAGAPGDAISLQIPSGFFGYRWPDGSVGSAYQLMPGATDSLFSVQLTDFGGCNTSLEVHYAVHYPELYDVPDTMLCVGDAVPPFGGGRYIGPPFWGDQHNPMPSGALRYQGDSLLWMYATGEAGCFLDSVSLKVTALHLPEVTLMPVTGCTGDEWNVAPNVEAPVTVQWPDGDTATARRIRFRGRTDSLALKISAHPLCNTDTTVWQVIQPLTTPQWTNTDLPLKRCDSLQYLWTDRTEHAVFREARLGPMYWQGADTLWRFSEPGVYDLHYTAVSDAGCVLDTIVPGAVTVHESPRIQRRQFLDDDHSMRLHWHLSDAHVLPGESWMWISGVDTVNNGAFFDFEMPADQDTVFRVQLIKTGSGGCISRSEFVLPGNERHLYVPLAFSPNGDGVNDAFVPNCFRCDPERSTYMVFNRWGELVFKGDFTRPWTGPASLGGGAETYEVRTRAVFFNGKRKVVRSALRLVP